VRKLSSRALSGAQNLAFRVSVLTVLVGMLSLPSIVFAEEGGPPTLRLGRIGQDFANEGQCFPADGVFQVAYNENPIVHYLIARADCYAARGHGDLAREAFALAQDIGSPMTASERQYIERTIARLDEAAGLQSSTLPADQGEPQPELRDRSTREPNGYFEASALYRDQETLAPPVPQADLTEAHIGAEWGWYFGRGIMEGFHGFALFARAYGAVETDSVEIRDESLQAGVGLRLEPFRSADFVFRAEWLVPLGDDAREGWMMSASHQWGVGGDWRATSQPWVVANTYVDTAWLLEEPEYMSASAETRLGIAIPIAARLALVPHGIAAVHYREDEIDHDAYGEAGLGLGIRYWFDREHQEGNRGSLDLDFQYRWYVLEDTITPFTEDGTFVGRITINR